MAGRYFRFFGRRRTGPLFPCPFIEPVKVYSAHPGPVHFFVVINRRRIWNEKTETGVPAEGRPGTIVPLAPIVRRRGKLCVEFYFWTLEGTS